MKLKPVGFFKELCGEQDDYEEGNESLESAVSSYPQENEKKILDYLKAGEYLIVCLSPSRDYFNPEIVTGPTHILTDGAWIWRQDLSYYIHNYHVRLNSDFIKHMEKRNWTVPRRETMNLEQFYPKKL